MCSVLGLLLVALGAFAQQDDCSNGTTVCRFGCYNTEHELCLDGLSEMQCPETYGHVEWAEKCNCQCDRAAGRQGGILDEDTYARLRWEVFVSALLGFLAALGFALVLMAAVKMMWMHCSLRSKRCLLWRSEDAHAAAANSAMPDESTGSAVVVGRPVEADVEAQDKI
eukprot:TRINITY_DN156_c0_g1_i2.p1 TRINITY_DN156_c0_g1~~TRINITY_DN156_c0_g1_i2.p1  ORF type:complete len:168 (+),score=30.75 TRINITY_DN156_c0_g1_i2:88-591(+)